MHWGQIDDHGGRSGRLAWCGARQRGHLPLDSEARGGDINAKRVDPLETVQVAGDGLPGTGEDRSTGGVPGHRHRQVLHSLGPQTPDDRLMG